MKKLNGLYIHYDNEDMLNWWINRASKLVRANRYDYVVDSKTGKRVGVMLILKGLRVKKVLKEYNEKFGPMVRHIMRMQRD